MGYKEQGVLLSMHQAVLNYRSGNRQGWQLSPISHCMCRDTSLLHIPTFRTVWVRGGGGGGGGRYMNKVIFTSLPVNSFSRALVSRHPKTGVHARYEWAISSSLLKRYDSLCEMIRRQCNLNHWSRLYIKMLTFLLTTVFQPTTLGPF